MLRTVAADSSLDVQKIFDVLFVQFVLAAAADGAPRIAGYNNNYYNPKNIAVRVSHAKISGARYRTINLVPR